MYQYFHSFRVYDLQKSVIEKLANKVNAKVKMKIDSSRIMSIASLYVDENTDMITLKNLIPSVEKGLNKTYKACYDKL